MPLSHTHDEPVLSIYGQYARLRFADRARVKGASELSPPSGFDPWRSSLRLHIDYEAIGQNMDLGGYVIIFQIGTQELHIFWSR